MVSREVSQREGWLTDTRPACLPCSAEIWWGCDVNKGALLHPTTIPLPEFLPTPKSYSSSPQGLTDLLCHHCSAKEILAGFTLSDYKVWILIVQAYTGSAHPNPVFFFWSPAHTLQVIKALARSKLDKISLKGVIIGFPILLSSSFLSAHLRGCWLHINCLLHEAEMKHLGVDLMQYF